MVIGITGGLCTGKTKVAKEFKRLGARVIDLDELAHKAVEFNTATYKKIIKEFGSGILRKSRINRSLLAARAFSRKKNLEKLNAIIHPVVIKQMKYLINKFKKRNIVVVEAPLLFEANLEKYFDYIVAVKANKDIQLQRAIKNKRFNKMDAIRRINRQWPLKRKISNADFVIDNSGSFNRTKKQIKIIWNKLVN